MNVPPTKHGPIDTPRGGAMKFTYKSGSRPLEGYTIKRGVGQGGFGEVYFATSDAGKEVALKLIRRNLEVELRGVTHCLNLKHPNLVGLFDIRQDDNDDRWVVMEFVSGESLEDAIDRNPNGMPTDEVMAWMRGIAAGVAYLHDHGIVHRDLKPGNIFLDESMVKIGDYGLSKFISCSRRSGQTESVGTVHYMAPEVANGRYGKEIDIYALGIMLFEMLTGQVPFEGESVGEILMKHLTAEPRLDGLPEPFRTAVSRALTKDPEARIRSVAELMALLPSGGGTYAHAGPTPPPPVVEAELIEEPSAANDPRGTGVPPVKESADDPRGTGVPPVKESADQPRVVEAQQVDEEPIWSAVRAGLRNMRRSWQQSDINPGVKTALQVVAIIVLVMSMHMWVPTLAVVAVAYGIYWLIRAIVIGPSSPSPLLAKEGPGEVSPASSPLLAKEGPGEVSPAAAAPPPRRRHGRRLRRYQESTIYLLPEKSVRQRVMELSGSMLLSAAVVAVVSIVMMMIISATYYTNRAFQPEDYAWLAMTALTGTWAVLAVAKLWEGRRGDAVLRRFVMLVIGLALAGASYGFDQLLLVNPQPLAEWAPGGALPAALGAHRGPGGFYASDGTPEVLAYLAYFGFLFLVLRWWYQAEPLRPVRLSLWSTAVTLFWAWVLNLAWPFAQPWGVMLAVTISIAVQVASPWIDPRNRKPEYGFLEGA